MLKAAAFGDLERELATTRRVLERLPEEHYAWKPHEKSMALGQLAAHTVHLIHWFTMTLQTDSLDLATAPRPGPKLPSRAELLDTFENHSAALRATLENTYDAALENHWTLRFGERVFFTRPKLGVIREMCLNHMIHHRAQLCVYLRLLNVPVPQVYGPTADEPEF